MTSLCRRGDTARRDLRLCRPAGESNKRLHIWRLFARPGVCSAVVPHSATFYNYSIGWSIAWSIGSLGADDILATVDLCGR